MALPHLARRFSESRQFLMTDHKQDAHPLEVLWLKLRLFAGLCAQLTAFYREQHRPHLGLGPSRILVMFPKEHDSLLPARWDFFVGPIQEQEAAMAFVHETMPPAFQANLFQPPHSLDTVFKAPELREWPLGTSKEFTVLLRSMEKIRTQEIVPNQVRGIFHIHLMSDVFHGSSFSSQDVFCVKLPVSQLANAEVNIWMARVESPERGIILRGQSEPMSLASWEQIEAEKNRAISKTPVQFFRSFSNACDCYSLGLLLFQSLLGDNVETMGRLESCLPSMVKGVKALRTTHTDRLVGMGIDPIRLLFDEQGTLFSSARLVSSGPTPQSAAQDLPRYVWYASLELALLLVTREIPSLRTVEKDSTETIDSVKQMEEVLGRIQTIGEWIRLELYSRQQRRKEIMSVCQKVRREIS